MRTPLHLEEERCQWQLLAAFDAEGRHIGRAPLDVDRAAIVHDRISGMSLTQVAKQHRVSRATVVRLVKDGYSAFLPASLPPSLDWTPRLSPLTRPSA